VSIALKVVTPGSVVIDREVDQISAESTQGWFTMLPRHADAVVDLTQGLVVYVADGQESFLAVDGGTLVKCGSSVDIATGEAFLGASARELQRELRESFADLDERERRSRRALAHLEGDVTRGLLELDDDAPA
jgi:F-type H+-transporting ATPase subunit epsilon